MYKEIYFQWGQNIDSAVNELLSYKNKNILASGVFNGVRLYSDTVVLDDAYKKITSKNEMEFKNTEKSRLETIKKEKSEHDKRIVELSDYWCNMGREILHQDKWDYWDRIVPIRLNDLYHGMELKCCLDIIDILNTSEDFHKAKIEIENQNHSGMSFSLVCQMVKEFCVVGSQFVQYVNSN